MTDTMTAEQIGYTKESLRRAAEDRDRHARERDEAQVEIDGMIRQLKGAGVEIPELVKLSGLSRSGVYKALLREVPAMDDAGR